MKKELLSIMFLLAVSIAILNIVPEEIQNENFSHKLDKSTQSNVNSVKDFLTESNKLSVTFDIIRVSPKGDAVMAGKSEPNVELFLYENGIKISSFFSDANGEWVWISDSPLSKGLKVFNVRYFNESGQEFESSQEIYVLDENETDIKPIVLKLNLNDHEEINLYNRDYLENSLTVDILNYFPKDKVSIYGRAPEDQKIKIFSNDLLLGEVKSNFYGNWKFSSKEIVNVDRSNLKFLTTIAGVELEIDLSIDLGKLENNMSKSSVTKIIKEENSWRLTRKLSDKNFVYSEIFIKNSKTIGISGLFKLENFRNYYNSLI